VSPQAIFRVPLPGLDRQFTAKKLGGGGGGGETHRFQSVPVDISNGTEIS
jgi:hypothetical protein